MTKNLKIKFQLTVVLFFATLIFVPATAFSHLACHDSVNHTQAADWLAIERTLGDSRTLREISPIKVGHFETVKENLKRQKTFLQAAIQLARENKIKTELIEAVLGHVDRFLVEPTVTYAENWLIHFAMQEIADFHFAIRTQNHPKLDEPSLRYILLRLQQNPIDLGEISIDSSNNNKIQRSLSLMHLYTDFHNPRLSESKKKKLLGQERIPMPFFQRGFDISEINDLARTSRLRPVEIMSGIIVKGADGVEKMKTPIVDNRLMGVGKDASDHDFNHLGFEINAATTRELGRILFEGSESLSAEGLTVLNVIYFKAWHEWGINLTIMEPGTQWQMLLDVNQLRTEMSNPDHLGGDASAKKSLEAIESTVEFLKKKHLPSFWMQ